MCVDVAGCSECKLQGTRLTALPHKIPPVGTFYCILLYECVIFVVYTQAVRVYLLDLRLIHNNLRLLSARKHMYMYPFSAAEIRTGHKEW